MVLPSKRVSVGNFVRVQTSATRIEMAFLGTNSLAPCALDLGDVSWPASRRVEASLDHD